MNSQIIIAKDINIDKEYVNVLSYDTQQMLNLCLQKQVATANNYSFIRQSGNINTSFTYEQCLQSNYIAFQNPNYSNKWFFAFIDDVIYKGDRNTEIKFTVDAWSTWYDNWSKKMCFINRQHATNDTIGANTIPENLDVGDVVQEGAVEDSSYGNEFGYWVAISSNWTIRDNSNTTDVDKGSQYSGITVYDNNVFGSKLFLFNIQSTTDFVNLVLFLARTNADGHIADIENMFILPDLAIKPLDLNQHSANLGSNSFSWYTMTYDLEPETFDTEIDKITSFRDYTPKNNKCFVYPYNYLYVSNNQGSHNIYKYENFDSNKCVFENQFSISIGGSGRIVPKNYKNMQYNDDEALPLGKYPTCAWSSDAFTNWLTQNSVNIATNLATSIVNTGSSVANSKGESAGVGIGTSIAGNILGTIGQFRNASLLPNISGGQATGDIIWSANRNMFTFRQMRAKTEYMRIIDDYFTRFGYAVRRLEMPNILGRRYWNYIEIGSSEEIGYGDVPSKYMDIINNACRKGITIWHNHDNIGDYSLNNYIV